MTTPQISPLPPMPARTDAPVDFSAKADAALGALQPFADQANALALDVNAKATAAASSAASVAGVQAAVSNDRVLSQQAASNAAGSAAAAASSASTANSRATAAQSSANASEASAVRAEDAAQYVESVSGGAAPLDSPNFTGTVKVSDVPLGTAAFKNVGTDAGRVMEVGAYGLGGEAVTADFKSKGGASQFFSGHLDTEFLNIHAGVTLAYSKDWWTQLISKPGAVPALLVRSFHSGTSYSEAFALSHSGNLLTITGQSTQYPMTQKATTDAINARGFADASGVLTVARGALSNDMSNFLSSMTFDEMSSKIGGGGEIDFTTIAENATALTPQPGQAYLMNRTTTTALVTTLSCTHRPGKLRSWHMIISKTNSSSANFIPRFALSGLTEPYAAWSGGGIYPPIVSGVNHVMIAFTQIDQSVRAMVVDGW